MRFVISTLALPMRKRDALGRTEEMMVEALGLLMRLPDRERGFLGSGSRSGWPEVLRVFGAHGDADYPEGFDPATGQVEARAPRVQLDRRQVKLVEQVFLDAPCLVEEVVPDNRALVGRVLDMVRREGQPDWARIWTAMGGRRCGVTSDALRMRYERSLARLGTVAAERGIAGFGPGFDA